MKILYVAREVNHHLLPFAEALETIFPGEVWYAAIDEYETRRSVMHFPKYKRNWIFTIDDNRPLFTSLFEEADVVICHAWDFYSLILKRVQNGKLTFYFSERWFRPPYRKLRLIKPGFFKMYNNFKKITRYESFFYLAQGTYAAYDFKSINFCTERIFSFGYFTSIEQNITHKTLLPKNKINILWCGRLVECKNVEKIICAVINLLKKGFDNIHLTIIGEGPLENKISEQILPFESITLMKFKSTREIREYMNRADIYVFPSTEHEGWGAVVNEAMAEGCAFIGSLYTGAVKSIIEDNVNGLLLEKLSTNEIEAKIQFLIENPSELARLKIAAINTIHNWSPHVAAERFINVVTAIQNKKNYNIYTEGVMSLL